MATESRINKLLTKSGYEPQKNKTIIVSYAPVNWSDRLYRLFFNQFYVLTVCRDSIVLLPFHKYSFLLKKEVELELPFSKIRGVAVNEELLNYRIELQMENDTITLSTQQKELSSLRTSGWLSQNGGFGYNSCWHRRNLDGTLGALKAIPA